MTYLDELIAEGGVRPCPDCGRRDALRLVLMNNGMHYAKIVCDACNERHVTWAPKPDRPKKPRPSKDHLATLKAAWEGEPLYCTVCLRDERYLPTGVWMEAHHILEHQDAGTDAAGNLIPLCNECHQLVHWRRKTVHGEQVGKAIANAPG